MNRSKAILKSQWKLGFSALSLGLLAIACGKQNASTQTSLIQTPVTPGVAYPITGPGQCQAGYTSIAGGTCYAGDLATVCRQQGGYMTSVQGNSNVCKVIFHYNGSAGVVGGPSYGSYPLGGYNYFPRLSPTEPAGSMALNTGIRVFRGNTLTFGGNGGWGSTQIDKKSWLGGFFQFYTVGQTNCNLVGLDGRDTQKSKTVKNAENGQIAGLYGSDGTEAFLLGTSGHRSINNDGYLYLGINAPTTPGNCSQATITNLQVTHCQGADNTSYVCQ